MLKRLSSYLVNSRRVIRHRANSKSQARHMKVVKRTQHELAQIERAVADAKGIYGNSYTTSAKPRPH